MNNLIKIASVLALAATATRNLPEIMLVVRKAQIKLVQESKASNWPKGLRIH